MCIIAVKPADKIIKEEVLRECFLRNPDGAGISYVEGGRIVIKKGIKSASELVALVTPLMDRELVIHCRVASRGMVVNADNCHPFYIAARVDEATKEPRFEYAISHNGTLEWGHTNDKSDTNCFTEQFLTPMFESHPFILTWEWGRIAMERTISFGTKLAGRLNKMVIMTLDRRDPAKPQVLTYILNEFEGNWHDGVWYSNMSWDERTRPIPKDRRDRDFLWAGWKKGGGATTKTNSAIGADLFRWFSEPCANGWFWSYQWDAWINHKTGTICRELVGRQSPPYAREEGAKLVDLAGRTTLTKGEVNHIIMGIYEQMELGASPPDGKWTPPAILQLETRDPLEHLDSQERSLICKKAYDIIVWAGDGKAKAKGMSAIEKVKELRDWVKGLYEGEVEAFEIDGMTDVELDHWIIKRIKDGELTMEKVNELYMKQDKAMNGGKN